MRSVDKLLRTVQKGTTTEPSNHVLPKVFQTHGKVYYSPSYFILKLHGPLDLLGAHLLICNHQVFCKNKQDILDEPSEAFVKVLRLHQVSVLILDTYMHDGAADTQFVTHIKDNLLSMCIMSDFQKGLIH